MLLYYFIISILLSVTVFLLSSRALNKWLPVLFIVIQLALTTYACFNQGATDSLYFRFDSLGLLLTMILAVLSITTLYHSRLYLARHTTSVRQQSMYYGALILLISAMTGAYFAENIALLWICVEATTLFVSLLIFHERSKIAVEASWKYLFISSVGVTLAFMGILFLSILASNSGLSNLSFPNLIFAAAHMNSTWLKVAFLMVLTGFSAKMGVFPFYTVTVDAHTAAPPPISAFISTTLMNVGFLGIFRTFAIVAHSDAMSWAKNVLLIVGIVSIALSATQLLKTKHFKRMFAFSSLEHMGIICVALSAGELGYYAAILQLILHSFVKASLFYQIGQAHSIYDTYVIKDSGGYFKLNPMGAFVILLAFISITAIPPSGLFISEFMVIKALFLTNQSFIAILMLILLTVIIFVFGKNLLHLLYAEKPKSIEGKEFKLNGFEPISQIALLVLAIYIGFNPPLFITDLINSAISVLK